MTGETGCWDDWTVVEHGLEEQEGRQNGQFALGVAR